MAAGLASMTDAPPPWASDYVGIPWRSGGRDRDAVDCYGLVRMVMEERGGVRLPLFDTVSATDLMRAYDEIEADTRNWRRVEFGAERPFDVLQVRRVFKHDGRFVSRAVHIGIVVGGGKVLHAEGDSAAGVVLADLDQMRRQTKAVWRHATLCAGQEGPAGSPFDCRQFVVEPGASIADIVALAGIDDATLEYVEIWIGGTRIDKRWRPRWSSIRPKAGSRIMLGVIPQGGGGMRIAAMVGVMVLATAAMALLPGIGGALLGTAIMSGGMFAVNTFLPAPVAKLPTANNAKAASVYSLTGGSNERRPGRPVPVLLGKMRFAPPAAAGATMIRGQKVYYRAVLALSSGVITDPEIYIGETPLADFRGITTKFERGWHPKQIRDRGKWNPNTGFPTGRSAKPGDKWTSDRAAGRFALGDVVVYNGLFPAVDERGWDISPGRGSQLFPKDVYEERFDELALEQGQPQIRETADGCDEVTVDLVSPTLGMANSKGNYENYTIKFQIYEAAVERPDDWALVTGEVKMTGGAGDGPKETFASYTWRPTTKSKRKRYRVRVKRTSPKNNTVDNQVWSDASWLAMKTFSDRQVVPPGLGVSVLYLEALGSDQLSGILDKIRVVAQSVAWYWDGTAWVWGPTSSPPALARAVYQMPQWDQPLTDDQIDLPSFQRQSEFCARHKLEYNAWIDYEVPNLHEFLGDIGICGFFALCRRDGKRSIAADPVEGGAMTRLFVDGVNCWDSTTRDIIPEDLHAVRVTITDEAKNWAAEERLVYNDGRDLNNSTRIEDRTFVGLTSADQATLLARMKIAEHTLRREEHQTTTNIQGLSCGPGDIVGFASIDLGVATAMGRISAVLLADDGDTVIGVELTHPVEMDEGETYGIRYSVGTRTTTLSVITYAGRHREVFFAQPPAGAARPDVDAVFAFAPSRKQAIPLVIQNIVPDDEKNMRVTMVAMPPTIEELKKGLPKWESYATLAKSLPAPVVTAVLSSAREMILTAQGDLITQVVITLAPVSIQGYDVVVMYRPHGVTDGFSLVQSTRYGEGRIGVLGMQDGNVYDFRVQYTHPDFFPSPAAEILGHRVAGKIDPPDAVKNLRLVVISSTLARLHWDQPAELDVRYGGTLLVRHSPDLNAASWQSSTSLEATEVSAAQLSMIVPLMPGTFLVMTRDSSGNLSRDVAAASTEGASIDEFDAMTNGTIVEEPLFLGARYNVGVQSGTLRLLQGDFDSVADVDAMPNFDAIGLNVVNAGVYYFADTHDMGEVRRVRLRRRIVQTADLFGDLISRRMLPISQWPSISGTIGAPVDTLIEARSTTGDPGASDTIWSPWTRLDAGEWVCRGLQFRAWLYTEDGSVGVAVINLQVFVEERTL